jgi:hypothetical protein
MSSRWRFLASVSLLAFAGLVMAWQFLHCDREAAMREWIAHGRSGARDNGIISSLFQSYIRAGELAKVSDIVKRDQLTLPVSGLCRYVDLALPKDARVFMPDLTGPTNYDRITYYYYVAYYLFPREVGVSLDQPARLTKDGFVGRAPGSDQEILANGYDAIVDFPPEGTLTLRLLKPRSEFPLKEPVSPDWFSSPSDTVIAFLLPLLTAFAGTSLFRFLFPSLGRQMPLFEQLACGLGLGMMAVAALTLGVKLCGFTGRGLILFLTAAAGIAEMWRYRKAYRAGMIAGCSNMIRRPIVAATAAAGLLVFLILFRLAGLQGLVDPDAMRWSLKAKIIHLYTGREIVQWFSNPRLAHAHLDYPALVPSLQAATYDSLGHVDEFVTKFWPTWMLLFLIGALASLYRGGSSRFHAPYFALLGLLLLPATQRYVQMEGGTLPMVFFTVLGFVQCALWLVEKDRARLGLGLTLLSGAALAKFEGCILLALVGSWMLLLPAARPSFKPSLHLWRVMGFCFLAALPFLCLRVRIPVLHYESGWAGYALHHPGTTLSNWPGIFSLQLARLFVNPDFASWATENGRIRWNGQWEGLSSLYNPSTLGLAWLCFFITVALWFAAPHRRQVIIWTLAMFAAMTAAISGVFASLISVQGLGEALSFTVDGDGGRYLLPMLLAWFATILTLLFLNPPPAAPTPVVETTTPSPMSSPPPGQGMAKTL